MLKEKKERKEDFYLQDSRFLRQTIGEVLKLNSPPGNPNGELLVEELRRDEQVLVSGFGPKLHHVPQAHPILLHATPPVHLLYQALRE